MPNWCQQRLVITGDEKTISSLKERLGKPYPTEDGTLHEGVFSLWNIVAPTDLDAYYERNKPQQLPPIVDNSETAEPVAVAQAIADAFKNLQHVDMDETIANHIAEVAVGNDWYNWNIRNWGTKWEVNYSDLEVDEPTKLVYSFCTAWSPVEEVLDKLAVLYPTVAMTLRAHDEGDFFACEIHWANGEQQFDSDIDINHHLYMEMYGECYVCEDGENADAISVQQMIDFGCVTEHIDVPDDISGLEA